MPSFIALLLAMAPLALPGADYEYTSRYLTMRDGVRIAVDLYLPKQLGPGTKLATILHQTRYFRSHRVVWPASLFWPGIREPSIARFVKAGYAYVFVDARGSGASFGTRTQEWSPDEVRDGAEVVNWIVAQPWSNGVVGATGGSYEATATDFLLTNNLAAVKATAPSSGMYDAYTDIAFPGGLKHEAFVAEWSRMTAAQDSNRVNAILSGFGKLAYRGVKPVQGDTDERLLAAAALEHAHNYNVAGAISGFQFRDESSQVEAMSPYAKHDLIERSGAAIYSITGWYDSALLTAAIKRFLNIRTPGSRLIIGAWNHQGENLSPFAAKRDDFDHVADMIRFFDHSLRGIDNGIEHEAPVRYYTVGEERWKSAPTWPPPGTTPHALYLAANHALANSRSVASDASDAHLVDLSAGTGRETRWNSMTGIGNTHSMPRDRREKDRALLVYNGSPLAADLEVTGHPAATLYLSSTETDGALFLYLEDVDPNGDVHYVTEGVLRLIHWRASSGPALYAFPGTYRSFNKGDAHPLVPGEIMKVDLDLYPISYLFRAGHSIRVAIAGADVDHFAQIPARAPTLTVYRDETRPSAIVLPEMKR